MSSTTEVPLFRNTDGVSYPYQIGDLLSITGTFGTTDLDQFYFFYNWNIRPAGCDLSSGINNSSEGEYVIYPNPVSSKLYINCPNNIKDSYTIVITDLLGRVVLSEKMYPNIGPSSLNLTSLSKGSYFLSILNVNNEILLHQKLLNQ